MIHQKIKMKRLRYLKRLRMMKQNVIKKYHICDRNKLEDANLIKKECKPCPNVVLQFIK